jgi:hypothetical protein
MSFGAHHQSFQNQFDLVNNLRWDSRKSYRVGIGYFSLVNLVQSAILRYSKILIYFAYFNHNFTDRRAV